jgi:hypothetical protein
MDRKQRPSLAVCIILASNPPIDSSLRILSWEASRLLWVKSKHLDAVAFAYCHRLDERRSDLWWPFNGRLSEGASSGRIASKFSVMKSKNARTRGVRRMS